MIVPLYPSRKELSIGVMVLSKISCCVVLQGKIRSNVYDDFRIPVSITLSFLPFDSSEFDLANLGGSKSTVLRSGLIEKWIGDRSRDRWLSSISACIAALDASFGGLNLT